MIIIKALLMSNAYSNIKKNILLMFATILCWSVSIHSVTAVEAKRQDSKDRSNQTSAKASDNMSPGELDLYIETISKYVGSYPPRFYEQEMRADVLSLLKMLLEIFARYKDSDDIEMLWRYGRLSAMGYNADFKNSAEEAVRSFDKALSIDINHVNTNFYYAVFLSSTAKFWHKSIPLYERLINMGYLRFKKNLALVYSTGGDYSMTIKLFKEYLDLYPQDEEAKKLLDVVENARVEHKVIK